MDNKKLLGVTITTASKKNILDKIIKLINQPRGFSQIISLNPENIITAKENAAFKKVVNTAQIQIIDGVGVAWARRWLKLGEGERYPGVDMMEDLIVVASRMRLRVLFIGGKANLADKLAQCYQKKYPQAKFIGIEGVKNINFPEKNEELRIFSIVADLKPNLVFVAFGSPWQEIWLDSHKDKLGACIGMGVGGGLDFLSGRIKRAPKLIRSLGLEWLYRLCRQPWRWRRQLKLLKFFLLVIKQKITK